MYSFYFLTRSDRFTFYEEIEKKIQKEIIPKRQYLSPNKLRRENKYSEKELVINIHAEIACHKVTCQGIKFHKIYLLGNSTGTLILATIPTLSSNKDSFILKRAGYDEFLDSTTPIGTYEFVAQAIETNSGISLCLVKKSEYGIPYGTKEDDISLDCSMVFLLFLYIILHSSELMMGVKLRNFSDWKR